MCPRARLAAQLLRPRDQRRARTKRPPRVHTEQSSRPCSARWDVGAELARPETGHVGAELARPFVGRSKLRPYSLDGLGGASSAPTTWTSGSAEQAPPLRYWRGDGRSKLRPHDSRNR